MDLECGERTAKGQETHRGTPQPPKGGGASGKITSSEMSPALTDMEGE